MNWKAKFQDAAAKLEQAGIQCRLRMTTDEQLHVECGFNYPEEMANQVWDAVGDDVSVCAEMSADFKASKDILGGPKRHFGAFSYARW